MGAMENRDRFGEVFEVKMCNLALVDLKIGQLVNKMFYWLTEKSNHNSRVCFKMQLLVLKISTKL